MAVARYRSEFGSAAAFLFVIKNALRGSDFGLFFHKQEWMVKAGAIGQALVTLRGHRTGQKARHPSRLPFVCAVGYALHGLRERVREATRRCKKQEVCVVSIDRTCMQFTLNDEIPHESCAMAWPNRI